MQQPRRISRDLRKVKKSNLKRLSTAWLHLYNISQIKITEMENKLSVPRRGKATERKHEGTLRWWKVLYLDCGSDHKKLHMWSNCTGRKHTHMHARACTGPPCTFFPSSCEFIIISKQKFFKKIKSKLVSKSLRDFSPLPLGNTKFIYLYNWKESTRGQK